MFRDILDRFLERYGKPPIKDMEAASYRAWRSVLAGETPRLGEPSGMRDSKPVPTRTPRALPAWASSRTTRGTAPGNRRS